MLGQDGSGASLRGDLLAWGKGYDTMKKGIGGRVALAAAVTVTTVGALGLAPAQAAHGPKQARVSLGACWLQKLSVGLGEDVNVRDYVTRWRAGNVQTLIQGTAPHARAWSITIYHEQHGKMVSFYDQQIIPGGSGAFSLAIGGARPSGKTVWVDPTANGGDSQGYLIYRVYKQAGPQPALPTVSFSGALPASTASCASLTADLSASIAKANKMHPVGGQNTQTANTKKLWPHSTPFRAWSITVNPSRAVPSTVTKVPLITQLSDPNIVYHAIFFNVSTGDLVLHGALPPISPKAPQTGVRYLSFCAYAPTQPDKPISCLDDSTIKAGPHGDYTIVVSPDKPAAGTWLNPGQYQIGVILLRWLLPHGDGNASFCLPAIGTRQPGETTVPALPAGC